MGVLRCLQAGSLPPSLPPTPSCTGSSAVIKAAETLGAAVLFLPAGLGTPPPAPPVPQFPSTRPQRTEKRPHPQRPLYCEICCCPPPRTGHVGLNKYFSMNPPITTENNKKHPLPSLPFLPQPPPLSPPWPHLGGLQGLIVRLQPHPLCSGYGCSIEDGGGRDALHWAQLQPQGVALGCPTLPGGAWHRGGPSTPPPQLSSHRSRSSRCRCPAPCRRDPRCGRGVSSQCWRGRGTHGASCTPPRTAPARRHHPA